MTVTVRAPENEEEFAAAMAVRHAVFVLEQGVSIEEELDGRDETADHLVVITGDGAVVGTCRILRDDPATARIGRMAVLDEHRGNGYAALLVAMAEAQAASAGADRVVLDAQLTAREFYRRAGYSAHGEVFLDAGIEHIAMSKQLR